MQAKLKARLGKLKESEQARVRKEIKMAKLREIKDQQAGNLMKVTSMSGGFEQVKDENKLNSLTEKVRIMREPIAKHCYSSQVEDLDSTKIKLRFFQKQMPEDDRYDYFRRQAYQGGEQDHELGPRRGSTVLGSGFGSDLDASIEDEQLGEGYITFKELLKRVRTIEG